MIKKVIGFFKGISNLIKLAKSIEKVETDNSGNTVVIAKNSFLLAANGSIGFYTDKNLIIESSLFSMNQLNQYDALNLNNTASLMESDINQITDLKITMESYGIPMSCMFIHPEYINKPYDKLIEKL